ncbi:hypothetical protein KR059_007163 [Drosophila kikkawai]|nr:hypothetical protein KR059_007163 [Drosophila kikkawai]
MRLNDFFLGSLILFHDFLIIFWLTFYWQIRYRPVTADNWLASSKPFIGDQDWPTTPVPKAWKQWSGDDLTQPSWDEGKGAGEEYTYEPDNANNLKEFKHKNKAQQNPNIDSRSQIPNRKKQKKKKKIKARPTTMDWSVFPAFTESSHYAEQQIREPVPSEGEARHPGVLYKVKPIDGREFPEMEHDDLNKDKPVGFDSVYGEAKGKPKVVFGNPPIGFPLADRLEALDPADNEWEVVGEEEKVNKFGHFVDEAEQLEKMRQENKTTFKRPQFLGDEMQGLNGDMQIPEWEVLTQEELRNLSDTHVPPGREEDIAEPLTTRPFYDPTDQPEFLKLVMNDTTVNPLAEPLTPEMFDEDYDILPSQSEYLELELNDTIVDK